MTKNRSERGRAEAKDRRGGIVVITPVRDEERYIETTIGCMSRQTLLPAKWIIVNDGSSDNTESRVKSAALRLPYLHYVSLPDRGFRRPGQGVIEAFYAGFDRIGETPYHVVAKFDGDLDFPPHTLETIERAFRENQKLGITGGVLHEGDGQNAKRLLSPDGFVQGPVKFYRKECFTDIGGLVRRAGWDGIDLVRARMCGWETGEIEGLDILHLKPMGMAAGEGLAKACEKYGDVSYYMGGYWWYFMLRVIGRSLQGRTPLVGYYMLKGFLRPLLAREARESKEFRHFLKKMQRRHVAHWLAVGARLAHARFISHKRWAGISASDS